MSIASHVACLLGALAVSACTPARTSPPPAATPDLRPIVDAAIRPVLAQHDVPGMAVAITVNGRRAYFNYGVADRARGTPVTETTIFEIGSISKTFTATLAAYAQVIGRLSLTERPGRYLPELRGSAVDRASLLELGTYTAGGLPLQFPSDVTDDGAMVRYFQRWQPDAAPGTQRRYSNPSIGLFGRLTALALRRDFADATTAYLFAPLGMRDSHVRVPERAMARYAWGYDAANAPVRVNPGVFAAEAYGVKTTAADLLRFVEANLDAGRQDEPLRRAIDATHVGRFRIGDMVQGLGWEQYAYPVTLERLLAGNSSRIIAEPNPATPLPPAPPARAATLFNKTGSTTGFGAYVVFVPERRIGIVLLANRNYPIAARVAAAHRILEQLAR